MRKQVPSYESSSFSAPSSITSVTALSNDLFSVFQVTPFGYDSELWIIFQIGGSCVSKYFTPRAAAISQAAEEMCICPSGA
jgi:hypothetical protein